MHQPTQNQADRALELLRLAANDPFASAFRLAYFVRLAREYGAANGDILDTIAAGGE